MHRPHRHLFSSFFFLSFLSFFVCIIRNFSFFLIVSVSLILYSLFLSTLSFSNIILSFSSLFSLFFSILCLILSSFLYKKNCIFALLK
jgi:hypothetical protein